MFHSQVKRYLSPYVVSATGLHRLSVVSVEDGRLVSVLPFETETANTEYVPCLIAIVMINSIVNTDMLLDAVKGEYETTAKAIAELLANVGNGNADKGTKVTLYSIDVAAHTVRELK